MIQVSKSLHLYNKDYKYIHIHILYICPSNICVNKHTSTYWYNTFSQLCGTTANNEHHLDVTTNPWLSFSHAIQPRTYKQTGNMRQHPFHYGQFLHALIKILAVEKNSSLRKVVISFIYIIY